MISMLIGLAGALLALIGWFGFHSTTLLIIGTALYLVETVLEWKNLNSSAKVLDVVIFGIGSIIAIAFTATPWYVGGMIAISIYSLILGVLGIFL